MRSALFSLITLGIGIIIGGALLPWANAGTFTVPEPSEVTYTSPTQPGTTYVPELHRIEVDLDAYMRDECKWNQVTITISADRTEGQISCAASGVHIKTSSLPPSFMWGELAIVWRD